jgi:carboxyl-terminal processing protease
VYLGTMHMRRTDLKFVVGARGQPYDGPVAILVDGLSASTSEIFAGGMKDVGRARVFGTRTAGAALPSIIERLPNGDGFQYAHANYISASGATLEGQGVTPDVEIEPTRDDLMAGRDPVLQAAIEWIEQDRREP